MVGWLIFFTGLIMSNSQTASRKGFLELMFNREHKMRDEFLRENSELNGLLHGISQEFPSDMEYLFATFPSLDNNM